MSVACQGGVISGSSQTLPEGSRTRLEGHASRSNAMTVSMRTYSHHSQGADTGLAPWHHSGSGCFMRSTAAPAYEIWMSSLPCPSQGGLLSLCATNLTCKVEWAERTIALGVGEAGKVSTASSSATSGVRLWHVAVDDPEPIRAQMLSSQTNGRGSFGEICGRSFMKCIGSHAVGSIATPQS